MVERSNTTRKNKITTVETKRGDKFHVEDPKKKWTKTRRYKNWVQKLTRRHKKNKQSEDLCIGRGSICKGDLGIPRKYMPQLLATTDVMRFRKFVKKAYRIGSRRTTMRAKNLRPSQSEISRKRIKNMIEKEGVLDKITVPLVVSQDHYVVDGHHRWAAFRMKAPKRPMEVIVIDAPIKDVLGMAIDWGAEHHAF